MAKFALFFMILLTASGCSGVETIKLPNGDFVYRVKFSDPLGTDVSYLSCPAQKYSASYSSAGALSSLINPLGSAITAGGAIISAGETAAKLSILPLP